MSDLNLRPSVVRARPSRANAEACSDWLAAARRSLGLSIEAMAAATGCGRRSWVRYESGERVAPLSVGFAVLQLLGHELPRAVAR